MAKNTSLKKSTTGLVLQGGGARGAYQAGVLKAISDILETKSNPFDVISGTSVGAINTASLASRAHDFQYSTKRLVELWNGLDTNSIFNAKSSSLFSTAWRIVRTFAFGGKANTYGLLDNRPLRELLEREFDSDQLEKSLSNGELRGICITTSCYSCGKAITYFEQPHGLKPWTRARREGKAARINVDHLMASSALPMIFPAVKIGHTYQGDGAMRLTTPLSPVIQLGADRIVVVGVRDAILSSPDENEEPSYPSLGEMSGHALDILFNDNLDADIERVERINRLLSQIPDAKSKEKGLRELQLLILQPSKDLREIARTHERSMPKAVRFVLKTIGAWNTDGRLPSYLLFEHGYISELIELGYNDTMPQAEKIKKFLAT